MNEMKNVTELKDILPGVMEHIRSMPKPVLCPVVKADIFFILRGYGIRQHSHSFVDYELAKKKIFKNGCIDSDDYEQIVKWIGEYLQV